MKDSIIIGLLQNFAVLLAFVMFYESVWVKTKHQRTFVQQLRIGFFLSGISVLLMFTPWTFIPGVVFDTRSVMISITGLFFGTIPTIAVMIITAIVRIYIGGDGIYMGLAVILSSGLLGLLFRGYFPIRDARKPLLNLFLLGLSVHLCMAALTLLLPQDIRYQTFSRILLPIFLIYIPATVSLGWLMLRQYKYWQDSQARLKLAETERRLYKLLESGNIISIILKLDGTIVYCNDYLLKLCGYERNEVIGQNWFNLFIEEDFRTDLKNRLMDPNVVPEDLACQENPIMHKNGQSFYISWYNTFFYSKDQKIDKLASIGVNLTDRINFEKELVLAKDRAEESDRLKTAFLNNMSHEIRTPMNGIIGFTDLLREDGFSEHEKGEFIEIIRLNTNRLLYTVNNIIEISRIQSGKIKVNLDDFDLLRLCEKLWRDYQPEADDKKLKFNLLIPIDRAVIVHSDRLKLEAILTNLIRNALKFTQEGTIDLIVRIEESGVVILVNDTGCGIPADQQSNIFKCFEQANNHLNSGFDGNGIGLAIVKAYADLIHAEIKLESTPQRGSSFSIHLPKSVVLP
jgi:PAS domain S-box-containing protein